jgi:alpha-N-acetylglucosamine transferase
MKKGVLIYALGHEQYYQMAVVLAASIKANSPNLPICLVTNSGVVENSEHKKLFDFVIPVIQKSIRQGSKIEYIKSKLFMYDHSPFDETIFLDADQIIIEGKDLNNIFDELKDIEFTMSNTGIAKTSVWCDIKDVVSVYGNNQFWNFHSEFVYFKKCKTAKKYFDTAKKVYQDNKIKSATRFANATMADELAFQCASIITGIYPHKENWLPNFWFQRGGNLSRKYPWELTEYYTYSIGGNSVIESVKNNYNILAKHYFAKLGLSNPYQVVDKRTFLPERKSF